ALGGPVGGSLVAEPPAPPPVGEPLPAALADEVGAVASWCDRYGHRLRLVEVEGEWASPWPPVPTFRPAP
ncbi:MAG: hypothetical protein ACRD0G_03145, partial [Acidimicrobiales bacterium]